MDSDGFVSLGPIVSFNRIKSFRASCQQVRLLILLYYTLLMYLQEQYINCLSDPGGSAQLYTSRGESSR